MMSKPYSLLFALGLTTSMGLAGRLAAQEPPMPPVPAPGDAARAPRVGQPWLGVGLETRVECPSGGKKRDCSRFLLISSVVVGSPAEAAGIAVGDTVVEIDGATPETAEFRRRLRRLEVGTAIEVVVGRVGERISLEVVPRARPDVVAMRVRARPSAVWNWATPEGEMSLPIIVETADSAKASVWMFKNGDDRHVVIVPSKDGWKVRIVERDAEGAYDDVRHLEVQVRDLEGYVAQNGEDMRRAWAELRERIRTELTPEMAALRDSVLAEARVKLEAVRKARSAYGSGRARVRYAPPPHLLEATRRLAGAEFEPLGPELSHDGLEQGLLVLHVIEGTPAYRLGLRRGDVVVEVGGTECSDVSDFRDAILGTTGGGVEVKWVRKGKVMKSVLDE
ncbi:MAG: PDZ domain-containing protein [Gemmatimonadota bacterium]